MADGVMVCFDLVVHLVGGKNVVVDVKVLFNGYLEVMEVNDETVWVEWFKVHVWYFKKYIDDFGVKVYWE